MLPPYFDHDVPKLIKWRDDDIVISVAVKSGTTWTMNIVHQLREGGDDDFECLYAEVPFMEFVSHPGKTTEEVAGDINEMTDTRRRAVKTHMSPPRLPFRDAPPSVKYIVVLRNPEEAMASMKPFMENHTDEFYALWNIPAHTMSFNNFKTFYQEMVVNFKLYMSVFQFMKDWWPLRNEPNVLMMHFKNMKDDHEGSVRKIADFLGFTPTDEQWPKILEHTSFSHMKKNHHQYEGRSMSHVRVIEDHGMVRKGVSGHQHEDGITEEISQDLAARGREVLTDEVAFKWLYEGGPLP